VKVFTTDHAKKRISAVVDEIERLKQSEFPYTQPRDALELLASELRRRHSVLNKLQPDAPVDAINEACSRSLDELHAYVPLLGFILRSTNVRNAFEAYSPLLRLAQSTLEPNSKLIVSSEWEYSPFVYRPIGSLPGFVLIGLPAPESSNPLLVPLAGHELGHSVWVNRGLSQEFKERIEEGVLHELSTSRRKDYEEVFPHIQVEDPRDGKSARTTLMLAYTWALLQTEEIFCDFFGLRLFAESYLYAFTYLISPGRAGSRSTNYPNIKQRVCYLGKAAEARGISVPVGFQSAFIQQDEPDEKASKLLL